MSPAGSSSLPTRTAGSPSRMRRSGRVSVAFPYMATADVGGLHSREVQVVEGRESQVWFAPPPGTPDVPVEFVVGDGSEAHRLAGLGLRNPVRRKRMIHHPGKNLTSSSN